MNIGYSKKDGSIRIFFESYELKNAYAYFSVAKELEEKDKKVVPLLIDIIYKDKSSGMFCFEFAFKNREFGTRFFEVMIEAYKIEGPIEEISKIESTLNYINFSQHSKCLN